MPTIKQAVYSENTHSAAAGTAMTPQFITIHSTGNPASTAQNEADYVCYNSTRQASFHYVCDEKQIVQVLPTNEIAWHAGDGGSGNGNRKSVAIEICESGNRKAAVDKRHLADEKADEGTRNSAGECFPAPSLVGKELPADSAGQCVHKGSDRLEVFHGEDQRRGGRDDTGAV